MLRSNSWSWFLLFDGFHQVVVVFNQGFINNEKCFWMRNGEQMVEQSSTLTLSCHILTVDPLPLFWTDHIFLHQPITQSIRIDTQRKFRPDVFLSFPASYLSSFLQFSLQVSPSVSVALVWFNSFYFLSPSAPQNSIRLVVNDEHSAT